MPVNFFKFANIRTHSSSLNFIRFIPLKMINSTGLVKRQQNLARLLFVNALIVLTTNSVSVGLRRLRTYREHEITKENPGMAYKKKNFSPSEVSTNPGKKIRACFIKGVFVLTRCHTVPALSEAGKAQKNRFDMPSSELASTLNSFAEKTGMELSYHYLYGSERKI